LRAIHARFPDRLRQQKKHHQNDKKRKNKEIETEERSSGPWPPSHCASFFGAAGWRPAVGCTIDFTAGC
jgi:hypothetical protein